ncbi:MAG: glycosyl transferase family protein [Candidatus Saccharibacteria bacterium]|nr:glycosyl transferase family protein [Candidatus Saccharibacteria bacterium]
MDLFAIVFSSILTTLLVFITFRLYRSLQLFRIRKNYTAAISAPSVSVCIPARNETHAMTQCLERVLASDYRKLEIIVYDDSSADDTSILVRSFAHAGVRFVAGGELPDGWLGKNHALEVLAREASGTYVVFMDVDTYITPTTISQMVGYIMTEDAEMVSVIPGRSDTGRGSVLFGHLRYFWELVFSTKAHPASSSSFWITKRHALLETIGGFANFKDAVAPESVLAGIVSASNYRCLVANATLGVTYEKKWSSQVETSYRLLYPKVGGVWWKGCLAIIGLLILNSPIVVLLSGFFIGWDLVHLMALWMLLAFMAMYAVYTSHVWRTNWWLGGFLWPIIIFQELILFGRSMYGYMRHTITWKGRPVTPNVLPMSRVVK